MGTVSNIIDALRRLGSPTEKSALQRQDRQIEGREVLSRRRKRIVDPLGVSEGFVATLTPVEETVTPLSHQETEPIAHNAALVTEWLKAASSFRGDWRIEDLDSAFKVWLEADDRLCYSDEAVVAIVGAAFGELCAKTLDMQWVRLRDDSGECIALRGKRRDVRAFPFQAIEKRIAASEYGFFVSIYISIKAALTSDQSREL